MLQRLFVCGVQDAAAIKDQLLKNVDGDWLEATIRGRFYPQGIGPTEGHPAVVLDVKGEDIKGLVFSSDHLDGYWQELDAFKGAAYLRVSTLARIEDGSFIRVHVYVAE